jgi:subtilase family serine protease
MKIALLEDSSDRFDRNDLQPFLDAGGAPVGASTSNVSDHVFVDKSQSSECGRDDRGQEATIDVDAAITMAPLAQIDLRYEDLCARGDEGTIALQRALDDPQPPNVIVLPIVAGPVFGSTAQGYGPTSIPYLEAALRGIPIVVPSGDDGAYGYHIAGIERPAVAYPCVLAYVICVGGTQLGEHTGQGSNQGGQRAPRPTLSAAPQIALLDEGPWNDGFNASGGGVSGDPRPPWQVAPETFEFSPQFVKFRIVPDVSADAAGHLLAYWHGYNFGGVAGTSESAALVAAEIAAINAGLDPSKRITSAGDLYALARAHPEVFRGVTHENDRGYTDNTLRPRRLPLPLDYRGPLPPAPPIVPGCTTIQPRGCTVASGYNAVTGIGSLRERAAVNALR